MEQFVVSARKYRPQSFEDVVGQEVITKTLRSAIANNHLAQAFLFCGPRGVGKTTCARILAREINIHASPELANEDFSFNIFELDAASNNKVDDIRQLIEQVRFAPQVGKYKVYIIDEVHMLSTAAFNAFLKTLEEPPHYAIFILATTEKHKVLPTIISRCQVFDFQRIRLQDMVNHLKGIAAKEGVNAEQEALEIIAQKADGGLRDALSIFDQLVSFSGNTISYQDALSNLNILDYDTFFKAVDLVRESDGTSLMLLLDDVFQRGFDPEHFFEGFMNHVRNLMLARYPASEQLLEISPNLIERYRNQAAMLDKTDLFRYMRVLRQSEEHVKRSLNPRILTEFALMEMCAPDQGEKKNDARGLTLPEPRPHAATASSQPAEQPPVPPKAPQPTQIEPAHAESMPSTVVKPAPQERSTSAPAPAAELNGSDKSTPAALPPSPGKSRLRIKRDVDAVIEPETQRNGAGNAGSEFSVQQYGEDAFTPADLKTHWLAFAERFHHDDRLLHATLINTVPAGTDAQLAMEVHNDVEKNKLNEIKGELLDYLRKQLNNKNLQLSVSVAEQEQEILSYQPGDKFKAMQAKNPLINTLRERFDLDLEY